VPPLFFDSDGLFGIGIFGIRFTFQTEVSSNPRQNGELNFSTQEKSVTFISPPSPEIRTRKIPHSDIQIRRSPKLRPCPLCHSSRLNLSPPSLVFPQYQE
jgi:hypothetical protein